MEKKRKQLLSQKPQSKEEYNTQIKDEKHSPKKHDTFDMTDLMIAAIDRLAGEMYSLKGILGDLVSRYRQILCDLGRSRIENAQLHKEVEILRQRQLRLVQELRKYVETGESPEVDSEVPHAIN